MFDFQKLKLKRTYVVIIFKKSITGQQHWSKLKTVHVLLFRNNEIGNFEPYFLIKTR